MSKYDDTVVSTRSAINCAVEDALHTGEKIMFEDVYAEECYTELVNNTACTATSARIT